MVQIRVNGAVYLPRRMYLPRSSQRAPPLVPRRLTPRAKRDRHQPQTVRQALPKPTNPPVEQCQDGKGGECAPNDGPGNPMANEERGGKCERAFLGVFWMRFGRLYRALRGCSCGSRGFLEDRMMDIGGVLCFGFCVMPKHFEKVATIEVQHDLGGIGSVGPVLSRFLYKHPLSFSPSRQLGRVDYVSPGLSLTLTPPPPPSPSRSPSRSSPGWGRLRRSSPLKRAWPRAAVRGTRRRRCHPRTSSAASGPWTQSSR